MPLPSAQGSEPNRSSPCPSGTQEVHPPGTQPPGSSTCLLRIQDSQSPRPLPACPPGLCALPSYRVWQWAADSTQCAEMREAPQLKRPRSNRATCHGWEWGSHSSPPSILSVSSRAAGRGGRGQSPFPWVLHLAGTLPILCIFHSCSPPAPRRLLRRPCP